MMSILRCYNVNNLKLITVTPRQLIKNWLKGFNQADVEKLESLYAEQAIDETGKPFVASKDRPEWRISYVESPLHFPDPLCIDYDPYNGPGKLVRVAHVTMMYDDPGVMRLLRV